MSRRKRNRGKSPPASDARAKAEKQDSPSATEDRTETPTEDRADTSADVKVSGWVESDIKATRKTFPDPSPIDEPVRIALTAEANAELVGHARESLDAEVCGVLVGTLCQDEQGPWVSVEAAIRGTSAKQGGAHVTYTQETWDKIHEVKDRDYPKLQIVGWYHSHPGFGVAFSDMDMFVQQNFFAGPAQLALVLDPVSGDQAVCANAPDGLRHISRLWVDGRECVCWLPRSERSKQAGSDNADEAGSEASEAVVQRLKAVEERLQHLLQVSDEERHSRHNSRLMVGMVLALIVVLWISVAIYDRVFSSYTPPKGILWSKVPVQLEDGKTVLMGVRVVSWELPPELRDSFTMSVIQQLEEQARKLQEEQAEKEQESGTAKKK